MVYRYNGVISSNESVNSSKICSKCNLEKKKSEFSMDRSKKDGRFIWCKDCKYEHNQKTKTSRNLKQKEYNQANKIQIELARLERRSARLEYIWNLKKSPCADCGQTFHPFVMDFDHTDRSLKSRDVSQINRLDEIAEEVKKCEVVCSNCHRLRTYKVIENNYRDRVSKLQNQLDKLK